MSNDVKIESWMFRVSNEYSALLLSLAILVLIGFLLSILNIYLMVFSFVGGLIFVKLQQSQYLGSAIRIHQSQYPEIFEIFKEHAVKLGIKKGSIFIKQDPTPNAFTLGINNCTIVLHSALVEGFDEKELSFVIGHELGHFKAGHTKISSFVLPLGNGNIFSNLIFGFWQRKTEYTADRCGLILTKDLDSSITGLLKLTVGHKLYDKLNMEGYLSQIKKSDINSVKISEILVSHPFTTNRIKNLLKFWKNSFRKI